MGIREQLGAPLVGDWLPIVKFDALSGRFSKVDRDALGQPVLTDLLGKTIGIDFADARIGWMKFGLQGPIRFMAPVGCTPPERPDEVDVAEEAERPYMRFARRSRFRRHRGEGEQRLAIGWPIRSSRLWPPRRHDAGVSRALAG